LTLHVLEEIGQAVKRIKWILLFVTVLYVCSYLCGWYLTSANSPLAVQTGELIRGTVATETPFTTVTQLLRSGDLLQAILATFAYNLGSGAFLATTLPGIIPLVGALITIAITVVRGFVIGVTYPAILSSSISWFAVGMGTIVLELGAYVFSGAAGIHIAISTMTPQSFNTQSRWIAFKQAWKDAARVYVIVIILLALGATWEMTGLFLITHP